VKLDEELGRAFSDVEKARRMRKMIRFPSEALQGGIERRKPGALTAPGLCGLSEELPAYL